MPPYVPEFLPNVHVGYCASADPQQLFIDLTLTESDPNGWPAIRIRDLIAAINAGAAGGAHFAPWVGAARLLSGPRPSLDVNEWYSGPVYKWVIEVRGVSPYYLRSVVEALTIGAHPISPASLTISGSLPSGPAELTVGDIQLKPWSTTTATYPGRWPNLPFTVKELTIPRGCALRIGFARDVDSEGVEKLNEVLGTWGILSATYPNLARDGVGYRSYVDRLGFNHREYSRFIEEADVAQDVLTSTLLNVLARFSRELTPIEFVDVRMP